MPGHANHNLYAIILCTRTGSKEAPWHCTLRRASCHHLDRGRNPAGAGICAEFHYFHIGNNGNIKFGNPANFGFTDNSTPAVTRGSLNSGIRRFNNNEKSVHQASRRIVTIR